MDGGWKAMSKKIKTESDVKRAAPGRHVVENAPGLILNVSRNGERRSWSLRYSVKDPDGKLLKRREVSHEIPYPTTGIADAKAWAAKQRGKAVEGVDILNARQQAIAAERVAGEIAEKKAAAEANKVTFRQAAESYVEEFGPGWKHRYAIPNWINPIRTYAYPIIGDLSVNGEIKVAHIRKVTDAAKAIPGTARRLRAHIAQILDEAGEKGWRDEDAANPAAVEKHRSLGRRVVATASYRRVKGLSDAPAVFQRILKASETSTALAAWALMIACQTRPSEALNARWDEIDLDKGLWTIPGDRMKSRKGMGVTHVIPLSSLAFTILNRQLTGTGGRSPVFPSPTRPAKPLSYEPFARGPKTAGLGDVGAPHSWRSVGKDAATDGLFRVNGRRVDWDLSEAALAHKLPKVQGAYRRETGVEERRLVMEAYARWLTGEGADVIAFLARA
jgi:integrase